MLRQSARFKIIIIDEVHMLTREAFNALLKTLEEPPPHAKFILATTEAHKVPITIVSRCQRYDFRRIGMKDLAEALQRICNKESISIEARTLEVIARIADGSMRDSLSLLDQVIAFSGADIKHEEVIGLLGRIDPALTLEIFTAISQNDGASVLNRFRDYVESGGDEKVFNQEMMDVTRDIMAAKLGSDTHRSIPGELASAFSIDQLERLFKIMLDLEFALRSAEHPRLIMDVALIKMSQIRSLQPLEAIIAEMRGQGSAAQSKESKPGSSSRSVQAQSVPPQNASHSRAARPEPPTPLKKNEPASKPAGLLEQIVAQMTGNEALAAHLLHGSIVEQSDEKLMIGFSQANAFHFSRVSGIEKKQIFEAAVLGVTGKPLKVEFMEVTGENVVSVIDEQEARKKKLHDDRIKLAMEQPIVEKIVGMFDGRIREVNLHKPKQDGIGEITE